MAVKPVTLIYKLEIIGAQRMLTAKEGEYIESLIMSFLDFQGAKFKVVSITKD